MPFERSFASPALSRWLSNLSPLSPPVSDVNAWKNRMIHELPAPESAYPGLHAYRWIDDDQSKGLALNKSGHNSTVALIVKEADQAMTRVSSWRGTFGRPSHSGSLMEASFESQSV